MLEMMPFAVVVLAAGESRRLGQPKQLVPYRGRPLVTHAVQTALAANLGPVYAVLGANALAVRGALAGLPVHCLVNDGWAEGIGSSIRAAVSLVATTPVGGVLLMLCDQPDLTPDHLIHLNGVHQLVRAPIVASHYAGVNGVPALFTRELFPELQALAGDTGARCVINADPRRLVAVAYPHGVRDVDVPADLEALAGG